MKNRRAVLKPLRKAWEGETDVLSRGEKSARVSFRDFELISQWGTILLRLLAAKLSCQRSKPLHWLAYITGLIQSR
jgi:hypothetical protein